MVGVSAPSVAFSVWIWAAFDPVLIAVAVYLGWRADQAGKIFIAASRRSASTLLVDWLLTAIGIPWMAPLSQRGPTLIPVRSIGAVLWAALAYAAHRWRDRTT